MSRTDSGGDTVALYWPRDTRFRDFEADLEFIGEGVYQVPARLEAFYRTRGWEDPPEDHDDEPEEPRTATNPNQEGPTREELEGQPPDTDHADETAGELVSEDDEPEAGGDGDESEAFDAAGFVDDHHASVVSAIEDGEADDHLPAVRDAESEREGGPRDSVIDALDDAGTG